MATLLLVLIYISYVSLGLPDSLLGAAWPVMRLDLHMPLSAAGILSMLLTGGTMISGLLSSMAIRKIGTVRIVFFCILLTAASLYGFSVAPSFRWLCVLTLILGLGGGAVDAALNNFVALHYTAKHMSWLHCLWGIGATAGPLIMSLWIMNPNGWRKGYFMIAALQFGLILILSFSGTLWKNRGAPWSTDGTDGGAKGAKTNPFGIRGGKVAMLSFFCYCAIETTTGLWGSSYLVNGKGVSADLAAQWVSFFYLGITVGRFISGVGAIKFSNQSLMRIGLLTMAVGILIFLPTLPHTACLIGFVLIGLGGAPLYPCMLHDTPKKFGAGMSQAMMGIEMAAASLGSTCMPPLFGYLAAFLSAAIFPVYLLVLLFVNFICVESGPKYIGLNSGH